jgi:hypothetical protein
MTDVVGPPQKRIRDRFLELVSDDLLLRRPPLGITILQRQRAKLEDEPEVSEVIGVPTEAIVDSSGLSDDVLARPLTAIASKVLRAALCSVASKPVRRVVEGSWVRDSLLRHVDKRPSAILFPAGSDLPEQDNPIWLHTKHIIATCAVCPGEVFFVMGGKTKVAIEWTCDTDLATRQTTIRASALNEPKAGEEYKGLPKGSVELLRINFTGSDVGPAIRPYQEQDGLGACFDGE